MRALLALLIGIRSHQPDRCQRPHLSDHFIVYACAGGSGTGGGGTGGGNNAEGKMSSGLHMRRGASAAGL